MKKKKNRKLLFQIGVVLVPLCLLMLALMAESLYTSTVNSYLKSQKSRMEKEMDESFGSILSVDGSFYNEEADIWCYDYWDSHASLAREPLTEDEREAVMKYIRKGENIWSAEWLKQQSEEIQNICAKLWLYNIQLTAEEIREQNRYEDLFLIDVDKGREGFVYFFFSKDHQVYQTGDTIPYRLSDHPGLQELLKDASAGITFERAENFPDAGSYNYMCYKPVVLDGKIRAVMGASYGWERLRGEMAVIFRQALTVSIAGMVLALVLVLLFLYRWAIAPVEKIQHSITHYIGTRDTNQVVRELGGIRERNELGLLSDNLSEMVTEIDRYTRENIHLAQEKQRIETELKLASSIQHAMLQSRFPESEDYLLSASMVPAKEVGGDFYDFFPLDETHLALVIADVSGKGIPAALFMMMTQNMIKNYARSGLSPAEVLSRTNRDVLENENNTMFVTVWLGYYETTTGHILAVDAGHEYPMIRKKDGLFELIKDRHSLFVGGVENAVYREYELQLHVGDTLFLYTDGATEATNTDNRMLGIGGVLSALNRSPDDSPVELIKGMGEAIRAFVGDAPQFDDLTMLAFKRTR